MPADRAVWRLEGTYLEACNCDAICPCRSIGGRPGGRSTHGVCVGGLSWVVLRGSAGSLDLSGLAAVMVGGYDDDDPGSPWQVILFLDERGTGPQREALADILLGRLGGTPVRQFPWARKPAHVLGVHAVPIEVDHTPGRGWFRAGGVSVRVAGPVPDQEVVTCVIPGHDRPGRELYAELLELVTGPFQTRLSGSCAFETTFSYRSDVE
jgi:hypothetical protein